VKPLEIPSPEIIRAAEILWDYHRLGIPPHPSDAILVFGSNDLRVAEHAAALFHRNLAPWLLFSGARGRMTEHWKNTEAEAMAQVARAINVPADRILIENEATNTGQNIRFAREILTKNNIVIHRAIVVQKPYMERRTIAALDVQWPDATFTASSPPLIDAMVGDFQRIIDYHHLGFSSEQSIPDHVMAAFRFLIAQGHTSQLP
jgi:uncharacterized SAM-binding protein YcdF (DUF218 family)